VEATGWVVGQGLLEEGLAGLLEEQIGTAQGS